MYVVLNILKWIVVVYIFGTMLVFANTKQKQEAYFLDNIEVSNNVTNRFLHKDLIKSYLSNEIENFNQTTVAKLEAKLTEHPIVKDVEVFAGLDGKTNIRLEQRNPIVRVKGAPLDYYLDKEAYKMPWSKEYTPRLIVAGGYVSEDHHSDLVKIISFITNDKFWNSQIIQVYIDKNQDFILTPRVGDYKIILGDTDYLNDKFNKLFLFYKNVLKLKGWNNYSEINLKFNNQIVCTKK